MWKIATLYYQFRNNTIFIKDLYKFIRLLKNEGVRATFNKISNKVKEYIKKKQHNNRHRKQLKNILKQHPNKIIVILPMLVDWHIPLFQRPQHLAKNMAKFDILYFYCTGNRMYDNVDGFEEVTHGCYLTNRFDLVDKIAGRKKIYDLSSTDNNTDWNFVEKRLSRGDGILYQYIDEISSELSGFEIPKKTLEKHFNVLKDERCIVIPSATKLENEVKKYRSKNFKLVTNGVEVKHFRQKIKYDDYPNEIKHIVDKNKSIIGYFGAFASWFDYQLIIKLATRRPDLEILLLGWDYDGSIKKYNLKKYDNITVLGPIKYLELPKYAACFSVSTIPFLINDITKSTSPIKLFEYMAMGKPIVTTDMPECRKYESVLIGENHEDFLEKIDKALSLRKDKGYLSLLQKEAEENSWEAKARDIVEMIKIQDKING